MVLSSYDYPILGESKSPLCQELGRQLEMKEVVLFDRSAAEAFPPGHC